MATASVPAGGGPLNPVVTLHEEAVCAICLDYFTDPVSIGCGHNFCRVCITQLWGAGDSPDEEVGDDVGASGSDGDYRPSSEGTADDGGIDDLGPEEDGDDEDDLDEYLDGGDMDEEEDDASRDEYDDDDDEVWDEEEDRELWDQDPGSDEMWEDSMGGDLFFDNYDEEEEVMDGEEEFVVEDYPTSPAPPPRQSFSCPQCRKTFPHRNFRPNLQLANMVQIICQMHPQPLKTPTASAEVVELAAAGDASGVPLASAAGRALRVERTLCEKHQEPLKLFCEADEEPICVVCRESRSHKHHSVMPLEEVVQEYKAKLQGHLDPLKKKLEAVLKQKSSEQEKVAELQSKMKLDMKEFESDFERLHQFLVGEQALLLHQLEDRYEILLARQNSNITHLEEQSAALSRLIAEAEDKSKQDGLQLLKDFKGTLVRCENLTFQDPEMVAVDPGKKYRNYFLVDVLMKKMEKFFCKVPQVDLTLDPETAHPRLTLSSDCRSVRLGERWRDVPDTPKRFNSDYCVLALKGFTYGRHCWEVEVGGRRGWAVGAARESARRKEKSGGGPHQKREIWCVGTNGKKYQALTATEQTALSPSEKLRRFCVYLDYERGQLSFYTAESMTHIHTFNATFRERIFPFFRILSKGTRIKLCN
ncbi:E3 ubiquitin-protein ligase TRIM41-like [Sphaerodactylus townsendi]|uniref:E3 ubiquitin-protein ligase TRIM41-like n=1 Tax=Sphaerodactylus townsendi TaxID=933632 RepID=UPI0020274835|nr:E3 ubiquitin-protein ligase TRIM41-like [Sphaerodactylus townsendi]